MKKQLKSLKSDSRHTLIFNEIKNFIIRNKLQPGDKLPPEKEITAQLGVSRTAVREAIKSMEALGIIEVRQGQGMFVQSFNFEPILNNLSYSIQFNRDNLFNVLQIRKALECFYIKEAVQKISQKDIEQLERLVNRMKVKAEQGKDFAAEDSKFHQTIFKVVGNDLLLKLLDIFWKLLRNSYEALRDKPDLVSHALRHRKLFKAIKKRDVKTAQERLLEHFMSTESRVKRATSGKIE